MRNFKISTRLALGFGLVIILMFVMSGIGGMRMFESRQNNIDIQHRQLINNLALHLEGTIRAGVVQAQALARLNDSEVSAQFAQAMRESTEQTGQLVQALQSEIRDPRIQEVFDQLLALRTAFTSGRDKAFQDFQKGQVTAARQFFNEEMPGLSAQYLSTVEHLSRLQTEIVDDTLSDSNSAIERGLTILGIATLLTLLFSPWFSWQVTRSITRPLSAAVALASAVARRKLNQDIQPTGKDEITQLEEALHEMAEGLRNTIGQVHEGAQAIATAAGQISSGNIDLSSRTEQQSSSLAETAASMEELTATVRQNADNAQQANSLAEAASRSASDGGRTVSQVVETMGDINEKSRQIAEIIGVIDSIAFQTNILALNAAVEAARAGEQGRGFAVVATEVRALAQRSAASAKEIRQLIDEAVKVVTHGNEEGSRAGESMQGIVTDIVRVTDIMGEISSASQEQTSGIEQVNLAIAQMDDVTRQNASLVEESAAAAASLREQADGLAQLVATFQLGSQASDHTPRKTAIRPMKPAMKLTSSTRPEEPAITPAKPAALPLPQKQNGRFSEWTEF